MRRPFSAIVARLLGGLIAVLAIWLFRPVGLPGQMMFYLFVVQAVALYAFIDFQAAIGPMPTVAPIGESQPSDDESPVKECA